MLRSQVSIHKHQHNNQPLKNMATTDRVLRIGTRASQLALWQAHYVRDRLLHLHPGLEVELVEIVCAGDRTLAIPLAQVGGKGLFLKELEQALARREIDIAVHSMKDVTVTLPPGLEIAAICRRQDPRDAFVSNHYRRIQELPEGSVVGSCSLRRRCQIQAAFPQVEVRNLRGNVNTRLARLDNGDYDALILAAAGLIRLALQHRIQHTLPPSICLPAVGQGALGIESRRDDTATKALVAPLADRDASLQLAAERAANQRLGGGCQVPIAVFAELHGATMTVRGLVGEPDGARILRCCVTGAATDAVAHGQAVATQLIAQGAEQILAKVYANLAPNQGSAEQ